MLKIESRRWVAVWWKCPHCGAQTADLMLTAWRWAHRQSRECYGYQCHGAELVIVERKWYTTFCIEPGVSVNARLRQNGRLVATNGTPLVSHLPTRPKILIHFLRVRKDN